MKSSVLRLAIGIIFAGYLPLLGAAPASAQCPEPHFRTAHDYGASLLVSMQARDFTLDNLTCLAQTLRNRSGDHKIFSILFFSSREAAEYFQPPVEGYLPKWPGWAKQVHAIYSFDANKHEESLDILPMGYNTAPSLLTRIDLPLAAVPNCRLETQNRCLMVAMEKTTYPQDALRASAEGSIVLTGSIKRNGRVTRIKVSETDVRPSDEGKTLMKTAIQDLKTWQFDTGGHDDPLRITYSYTIDTSLADRGASHVQWVPPDQVSVRANSRK